MLIHIDEDVATGLGVHAVVDALENLALAAREGKHILCVESSLYRKLASSRVLSRKSESVYQRAASQYSEIASLKKQLSFYLVVSRKRSAAGDWCCDIEWFSDSLSAQAGVLLGESIDDSTLWERITKAYLLKSKIRAKIALDLDAGGGGQMAGKIRALSPQSRIVIICVDSDKLHPKASIGATLKGVHGAVKRLSKRTKAKISVQVPEVREIENLIPLRWIEKAIDSTKMAAFEQLKEWREQFEAYKYFDLKVGMTTGQLVELREHVSFSIPARVRQMTPTSVAVPGLDEFLTLCVRCTERYSSKELCDLFTSEDWSVCDPVASSIVAIGCAGPAIRT